MRTIAVVIATIGIDHLSKVTNPPYVALCAFMSLPDAIGFRSSIHAASHLPGHSQPPLVRPCAPLKGKGRVVPASNLKRLFTPLR